MKVSKTIKDICKLGTGKTCCKYLKYSTEGFNCIKLNKKLKEEIDKLSRHAEGDNCEDLEDLE